MGVAPMLNPPALPVPIGQMKYQSRVSQVEEALPVMVTLISPPVTDLFLRDTVVRILEDRLL